LEKLQKFGPAPEYRLGLPAWAFPGWKGRYWEARPSPLADYARFFGTVEGNTTFYRIPEASAVAAWREAVAGRDFEFCFKLPRSVTHERTPSLTDLDAFLRAVEPLGEHVGPLLVQFPATAGPKEIAGMEAVLCRLSREFRYAVEVRHPLFFSRPELLEPLLAEHGCGRVMMDSRPIYQGDTAHPEVQQALHEKPDVPVLDTVYNGLAFVRLVLHPDPAGNEPWITAWSQRIAGYLRAGQRVYMMIHCPNNLHCPAYARVFHETLQHESGMDTLPALPPWPLPRQASLL